MNQLPPSHPGLVGASVAIGSGLVSFFSQSLVVVQWFAGILACFAAIAAMASVVRHWDKGHDK